MVREGDRVVVVYHEESPMTWKYAGCEGRVARLVSSELYEEIVYVELDGNESIHVAFQEKDVARAGGVNAERRPTARLPR